MKDKLKNMSLADLYVIEKKVLHKKSIQETNLKNSTEELNKLMKLVDEMPKAAYYDAFNSKNKKRKIAEEILADTMQILATIEEIWQEKLGKDSYIKLFK